MEERQRALTTFGTPQQQNSYNSPMTYLNLKRRHRTVLYGLIGTVGLIVFGREFIQGTLLTQRFPSLGNQGQLAEDNKVDGALEERRTIILITPTHQRLVQLADLTRLSQTLQHVSNIHWIVIEDANVKSDHVEKLLKRSGIPYTHLANHTSGYPGRGWAPRNAALHHLRTVLKSQFANEGVVYFADADNTYDVQLFNDYIRHVTKIGVWAVGLVGGAKVEAPKVTKNGTVVGWDVLYAPSRKYGVDMAGFAVSLDLILNSNATFHKKCNQYAAPEECFLRQFNVPVSELEAFGFAGEERRVLVWHTKTGNGGEAGPDRGFVI